ncbi:MAG: hypothetical protein ABFC67_03755 [Mizugakiibacter sp.]|uniref:hypothetical protein n=1 Tax=Mizugakiibacter sp. TaxID=1972610 RepID=UPI0031C51FF4|nr:hypothetical protein [Xanthomonadaceae bacterium]
MSRIFVAAMAPVLLLTMCTARASTTPAPELHDRAASSVEDAAQMVQQAFDDLSRNDVPSAQAELEEAIQARDFADLPADLRYRALLAASLLAEQNGDNRKAHNLTLQATAFDEADDTAWTTRLSTAFSLGDYHDAGRSLAVSARRWPEKLGDLMPSAIWQLHHHLKQANDTDADREMLDALFDAGWQDNGVEPSDLWRDLALLYVQRDEIERATTVALRIASGQTALSMLVDKRFDPITLKHPRAFDVDRLVAAEIEAAETRTKAHPDQLAPITDLQELLLITGRYPRVLSVSDEAVAHAAYGDGEKAYTDFSEKYNWVLDNRFRALVREGHWDDASRVEELAARRPEQGGMNVSQLINLGELYADLNRPGKAADAIAELGDVSPYGRMQLESVKLRIAAEKSDDAAVAAAMAYLREHRADAIATWEDALLFRGELDAAAALLIERLENPAWRNRALLDMQRYAQVTETPVDKMIHDRWNTITARPDVEAVMRKVGRVKRFDITAELR